MTITTNTTDRKALVKAIAEELGTTSTYLRAPTYGYQIGDFTVIRKPSPKHSRMRKRLPIQKRSPSPRWTFRFRRGMLR